MQKSRDKVTMRAIAEEAGVTLTTVSRILNRKQDKYAEATKARIFAIAERLRYRPNALVLGMQSGVTRTAGVMIPSGSQFCSNIICGLHEVFLEHDIIMLVGWNPNYRHGKEDLQERHIIHQLVDRRVDGVILRPGSEDFERSYFEEIWERDIPLIAVDRELSQVPTDFVGSDDVAIGRDAARHLLELGHRRLLFVGDSPEVSTSRRREEGFRQALGEAASTSASAVNGIDRDGLTGILERLRAKDRPTAVFCYCDPAAEKVAELIQQAGLSIPGNISLVGCGNQRSPDFALRLTTFDQHPIVIGRTAAQLFLDRAYGRKHKRRHRELIPADLVLRATTAAPPARRG